MGDMTRLMTLASVLFHWLQNQIQRNGSVLDLVFFAYVHPCLYESSSMSQCSPDILPLNVININADAVLPIMDVCHQWSIRFILFPPTSDSNRLFRVSEHRVLNLRSPNIFKNRAHGNRIGRRSWMRPILHKLVLNPVICLLVVSHPLRESIGLAVIDVVLRHPHQVFRELVLVQRRLRLILWDDVVWLLLLKIRVSRLEHGHQFRLLRQRHYLSSFSARYLSFLFFLECFANLRATSGSFVQRYASCLFELDGI